MIIKRGDIFSADLDPVVGSEQGGIRPVLVIQNDVGNRFSPTVIVLAITSKLTKSKLPTHVNIPVGEGGLTKQSIILAEQVRTIEKTRLGDYLGTLSEIYMQKVEDAIYASLGIICEETK
ncbi:MAG: type II toxin-antitoxin system PemK/MazF family toxin [Oscillospiraceae bacterium]|jgi:mRNA interferase MazF|nr:type II toxin-antitoxin system PemK/MazF family toxin [Oscillospiraceae bacterium]